MYKKKSDIITHEDIAEPGLVTDYLLKELEDVVAYTPVVVGAFKKMATDISSSLKAFNLDGAKLSDLKDINDQIEKANKLAVDNAKAKKIQAQAEQTLAKAEKEKLIVEEKAQKQQERKIQLTEKELAQSQIDAQKKKDRIALLKAEIVEMDKTAGSLQRVEAANTRLRIERKNLDTTTVEGRRRMIELNEAINRNNKYIIENSDLLKKQKLNVGNYAASIREAFEGTGILGDKINSYLSIITTFADKLEGIGDVFKKNTVATEANTAATELNSAANVAATEAELAASAAMISNTAVTEANTVATEAGAAAQGKLLSALKALATNPYVLAIAAIAGFTKILYENFTALEKNSDEIKAAKEALKAWSETVLVAGINSDAYAISIRDLILTLEELNTKQIDSIVTNQKLRTAAAKAREASIEEGKTIAERVQLLDEYIDKNKLATKNEVNLAKERAQAYKTFAARAIASGKELTGEQRKQVQESQAQYEALIEQQASETIKAQKQQTKLRQQYQDETEKMNKESQARELEIIDTYAKYKTESILKNRKKTIEQIRLANEQELKELIKQQEELGFVDANGIDHTEEFLKARASLTKKGKQQEKEIIRSTTLEIEQLENESNRKRLEAVKRFNEDLDKIQKAKTDVENNTRKTKEDGDLAAIQAQIENNVEALNDTKRTNKYTIDKYKQFYQTISELQDEYFALRQKQIAENTEFEKQKEKDRLKEVEDAIREKYFKEKQAADKAVRDQAKDQKKADTEIEKRDKEREERRAKELEAERSKSAAIISGIEQNAANQQKENERKRLKSARDTNKQLSDEQRKAREQLLKQEQEFIDSGLDALSNGLRKRQELVNAEFEKEIDFQKRNLEIQSKLAAEGKANTLAEAQAAIDQAEERKIQAQKRAEQTQQNIAIAKAFMDTLNQALQKNEPFIKAFGEATAAAGLTEAFLSKLISGSALEGTEDTGAAEGNGLDGKGGKLFMVHPNERILTKEQNKAIGGMSNEELVANATMYKRGEIPVFEKKSVSATHESISDELVNVMRNEIQQLRKVIQDKPTQHVSLNGLNEWTETIEERGIRRQVKYRQNSTRPSLRING